MINKSLPSEDNECHLAGRRDRPSAIVGCPADKEPSTAGAVVYGSKDVLTGKGISEGVAH